MGEQVVPTAVFAPVARTGVVAGLSWSQLVAAAVGLSRPVWDLVVAGDLGAALGSALWWTTPVGVLALGSWKGRSFLERVSTVGLFGVRRLARQTRVVVKAGSPADAGQIAIPGALAGRLTVLDMVGTQFAGGCFLWDKTTSEATVVLRVTTEGWALASGAQKAIRAQGLSDLCQRLSTAQGVRRVVKHSRTYPLPAPDLPAGQGTDLTDTDAAELADHPAMAHLRGRDEVITITVAARDVAGQVEAAGGGVAGVSWVLADRVGQVLAGLPACGVRTQDAAWWSAGQIRAAVRLAFDPAAAGMLAAAGWCLPEGSVLACVVDERLDHLVTDSGVHRTYWVESWPATPARAGFLADMVATGSPCRTFTQMWCPGAAYSAERRLLNEETSHNSATAVNHKLGRPTSVAHRAQGKELTRRRAELEAGYADVRYAAWVTVCAEDIEELRAAELWLTTVARGLHLKVLRGDQWAGFCTSALPLGLGARS
ncbi:hypothetical protein AGMMS50218_15180 [Actinomycetota bacterium]|nr:hypothetical protein AGMMS50218_15180 [Actinomycetota bacterium]